jgi:hypothetical protein
MAVFCQKIFFPGAERHQLLPLLVELGEARHRKMITRAPASVDEAEAPLVITASVCS